LSHIQEQDLHVKPNKKANVWAKKCKNNGKRLANIGKKNDKKKRKKWKNYNIGPKGQFYKAKFAPTEKVCAYRKILPCQRCIVGA
jgi:hypothetical protein